MKLNLRYVYVAFSGSDEESSTSSNGAAMFVKGPARPTVQQLAMTTASQVSSVMINLSQIYFKWYLGHVFE
jgi:hypothetical protein